MAEEKLSDAVVCDVQFDGFKQRRIELFGGIGMTDQETGWIYHR